MQPSISVYVPPAALAGVLALFVAVAATPAAAAPTCATPVPARKLPKSALTLVLQTKKLPRQVCRSADGASYTWTAGGADYRYHHAPAPGGGNAHGTQYQLDISPADTSRLRTKEFAFLTCSKSFQAHRYCAWRVGLERDTSGLHLTADDVAPPCKPAFSWASVLRQIAARFETCDQTVQVE